MRECFQASVNQVDHSGQSPLHIASANGNVEIVALLLEHQSNPNLVLMPVSVREYQWEHVWAGRTMIHNIPRCLVEGQMGRDPAARGVTSHVVTDSKPGALPERNHCVRSHTKIPIRCTQDESMAAATATAGSVSPPDASENQHLHLQVGGVPYRLSI